MKKMKNVQFYLPDTPHRFLEIVYAPKGHLESDILLGDLHE